jgi:ABC-type multidrug transport system fused ATPase/permease subunit
MKSVKITGIASKVFDIIENLRSSEIKTARGFWILGVYASTIGGLLPSLEDRNLYTDVFGTALVPELMSPVATFGIFTADAVSKSATLDTTRLFTSLSLLILLTQPLFSLFDGISRFAAALGCFTRIQDYLLKSQWQDARILLPATAPSSDVEQPDPTINADALRIVNGRFAWSAAHDFSLSGISCKLQKSHQLFIVGPVASGKSTLLRALLGELPVTSGEVYIFDKSIAYCDQTPWISVGVSDRLWVTENS